MLAIMCSCSSPTIWNFPADEFPGIVASGDTSYIVQLDIGEVDLEEVLDYMPGAGFFHAILAKENGREDLYPLLLETEWEYGEGFWRLQAGELLARYRLAENDYVRAEELASELVNMGADSLRFRHLYIETLYWQKRDEEVLTHLDGLRGLATAGITETQTREIELFRAVSSARLSRPGWKRTLVDFFRHQPPSQLHYRARLFIEEQIPGEFEDEELVFFDAIVALADLRPKDAAPVLGSLLTDKSVLYLTENTLRGAFQAYKSAGWAAEGARLFSDLIVQEEGRSSAEEEYVLYESGALLYRYAGMRWRAIELFEAALSAAVDEEQRERMRWYLLDTTSKVSVDRALELLPDIISEWSDPGYYWDTIELMITALVERRDWNRILALYRDTAGRVDPSTEARLAYICGAAVRDGLLEPAEGRKAVSGPADPEELSQIFFGNSMLEAAGRYYEFLGSAAVGAAPRSLNVVTVATTDVAEAGASEKLVAGYLSYGLLNYAYEALVEDFDAVQDATVSSLARALHDIGDFFRSIQLMEKLSKRVTFHATRENLELIFPRGYRDIIEEAAERNGIPPYLLFSLVRTESRFKADIVSHAGAVGLSQLMPATAADTAGRMGVAAPNLDDPEDNVAIGAYYLGYLLGRFEVTSNALFAYNAGPTRMNGWRREYAGLSEDLLLEAVPFTETRFYGRRVLASAVAYGYLYYSKAPGDVVAQFFSHVSGGTPTDEIS